MAPVSFAVRYFPIHEFFFLFFVYRFPDNQCRMIRFNVFAKVRKRNYFPVFGIINIRLLLRVTFFRCLFSTFCGLLSTFRCFSDPLLFALFLVLAFLFDFVISIFPLRFCNLSIQRSCRFLRRCDRNIFEIRRGFVIVPEFDVNAVRGSVRRFRHFTFLPFKNSDTSSARAGADISSSTTL